MKTKNIRDLKKEDLPKIWGGVVPSNRDDPRNPLQNHQMDLQ